jgi:acetylornithine deacetylase/succinyl-diaminopimelate desuccinylase-like protein
MTSHAERAVAYARENRERFLQELQEYIAIPSISTDPQAKSAVQRAAEWTANQLRALEMDNVVIYPTPGHPVVYGENLHAGADKPTVLIYGHYDVQPVEPLELWESPPFEGVVRGDYLYGRGGSDMKGQIVASLKAVEALLRAAELPVNVKFMLEGEEEVGSPNLEEFMRQHIDLLACDIVLNPDTGMMGADIPTITYGLRGMAYFQIDVFGPSGDLHSGLFGGAVHNPAVVLCELIAGMHDQHGRITLPGFYDKVRELSPEERAELARLPLGEEFYLQTSGAPALYGEEGYTTGERIGARPTLDVNGFLSGFTGEGSKTVLPAHAMAKVSMRLVPDQEPQEVHQQLLRYLEDNAPNTVRWEVQVMAGAYPSMADRSTPSVQALSQALETTWGTRPLFKREGGTVPVVAYFQKLLGVESVCTGFGLPDDNLHAPNERFHLPTYYKGIESLIHFFDLLGKQQG